MQAKILKSVGEYEAFCLGWKARGMPAFSWTTGNMIPQRRLFFFYHGSSHIKRIKEEMYGESGSRSTYWKNQVPSPDILPWLLKQNKQKNPSKLLNFKLCVVSVSKQIKVISECAENANIFLWKNKK